MMVCTLHVGQPLGSRASGVRRRQAAMQSGSRSTTRCQAALKFAKYQGLVRGRQLRACTVRGRQPLLAGALWGACWRLLCSAERGHGAAAPAACTACLTLLPCLAPPATCRATTSSWCVCFWAGELQRTLGGAEARQTLGAAQPA